MHQYGKAHTKSWSEKIASLDAYISVTPEYNHATRSIEETPSIFFVASE